MTISTTSPQSSPVAHSRWPWLVATFLGIGHLGAGPGTWASVVTILLWWLVCRILPDHHLLLAIAAAFVIIAIGIPASTRVARESGIKDPGFVVIDEVAGQMLPLIIAPLRWKYLLLSLILFRCFDILKPPPLRALERLPEGTGIMLDDVGAGVYALIMMAAVLKFWPAL